MLKIMNEWMGYADLSDAWCDNMRVNGEKKNEQET